MPENDKAKVRDLFDPIMWTVIGFMGFSLVVGTALQAAGVVVGNEGYQKWSERVLEVCVSLGIGFIGGAFKGFYTGLGSFREETEVPK